jgi:adhesin transport system membrane fusion protein
MNKKLKPTYVASLLLLLCTSILVAWSVFAEIEIAARGEGQVIAAGNNRRAQHLEGGVVQALMVREGDRVEEGQVIAIIVPEAAEAEAGERRSRIEMLSAQIARLRAEATLEEPVWPHVTTQRALEAIEREKIAWNANRESLQRRVEALEESAARADAESRAKRGQIEGLMVQEEAIRRSLAMHNRAIREGAGMLGRVVEVETQLAAVRAQLLALPESVRADERAAAEARARGRAETAQFRSEAARQLSLASGEMEALMENVRIAEDRRRRALVRSPITGTIHKLHVFAPGEVVPPHSTVADIVPGEEGLLFETRIGPDRIRGIRNGLPALVRLSAMDVSKYGSLEGRVVDISPDTARDERTGAVYYRVRIRTERHELGGESLRPGMQGEASIITGQRTVFRYFLNPLIQWSQVALTEK